MTRQDARVELARCAGVVATKKYVKAVEDNCDGKDRLRLLYAMHRSRCAHHKIVEREIVNRGRLCGDEYDRWVQGWTISAAKVLNGLLVYHNLLQAERAKTDLPGDVFRPTDGNYRTIQAFYAAVATKEASELKQKYIAANLPTSGFDNPYKPEPTAPRTPMSTRTSAVLIIIAFFVVIAVLSIFVNPLVLAGIVTAVVVLYIAVEAFDLRRSGKLKEGNLLEIIKLILAKRFSFSAGTREESDERNEKRGRK